MLTFVTFYWQQKGFPTQYTAEHVRRWARMVDNWYFPAHQCLVVTSISGDYGSAEVVSPDTTWEHLGNPEGAHFPSCYRRLWVWSAKAGELLGDRIVVMDLDCTILGDLNDVVDRPEPVVVTRDSLWPKQYNGGMQMLTAGARPDVWERFQGEASITEARRAGFRGSDQAWLSYALGPNMPTFTGVHSWKRDLRRGLPQPDSRVVMFHGRDKPWHETVPAVYRQVAA